MVEPGVIDSKQWIDNYHLPETNIAIILKNSPYENLLRGKEEIFKNLPFLESEIDDFLLDKIKKAKAIPLGIEPLVGYLLAKEREVMNLRLILSGKENKLPVETVRRRLRDVYI